MKPIIGHINQNNSPVFTIKVEGVYSGGNPKEFEAIMDTGFTGFMAMPMMDAFPMGLPLVGTTNVTLADGKSQARLLADAMIILDDRKELGNVILEPGSTDILLGIEFLQTFSLGLFITHRLVLLQEQSELEKSMSPRVVEILKQIEKGEAPKAE